MNGHNSIGFILRFKALSGEGNGNLLQYSRLENSMDRGAWQATQAKGHKESDTTEYHSLTLKALNKNSGPLQEEKALIS